MNTRTITPARNAYDYPLLIKRLLHSGVRYEPDQEIVYRDQVRLSYRELAPLRRFERPTYPLGGGCSIQLSYRGTLGGEF